MTDCIKTQNTALLRALRAGPITALQALDRLGISRTAARVWDLRREGWEITSKRISVRNRNGESCQVAQYTLANQQRGVLPAPQPGRGRMTA